MSLIAMANMTTRMAVTPALRAAPTTARRALVPCMHRTMVRAAANEQQNAGEQHQADHTSKPVRSQNGAERRSMTRMSPFSNSLLSSVAPPGFGRLARFAEDLQSEINSMFGEAGLMSPGFSSPAPASRGWGALSVPVDVKEEEKSFVFSADVPGLAKEDVKVQVNKDHVLTISGSRKSEHKEEEDGKVYRMERSWGTFQRSFQLPDNIDTAGVSAKVDNGVLRVSVPKTEVKEHEDIVNVAVN